MFIATLLFSVYMYRGVLVSFDKGKRGFQRWGTPVHIFHFFSASFFSLFLTPLSLVLSSYSFCTSSIFFLVVECLGAAGCRFYFLAEHTLYCIFQLHLYSDANLSTEG